MKKEAREKIKPICIYICAKPITKPVVIKIKENGNDKGVRTFVHKNPTCLDMDTKTNECRFLLPISSQRRL